MKIKFIIILILLISALISAQEAGNISDEKIGKVISSIEEIRGVKFKNKVEYKIVSREEMLRLIQKEVNLQYSKDELKYLNIMMKLLGLIDKDFDIEKLIYDLYKEQAGGLYDARTKRLYIADWIPNELLDIVLFHELLHALDDQYNDLEKFAFLGTSSDAKMAKLSVIEGIGTYYMLIYTFERYGMDWEAMKDFINFDIFYKMQDFSALPGMEAIADAPKFVRQQMLFPYFKGANFVNMFIRNNSTDSLFDLYESPPLSTEQIMHFNKYKEDEPNKVTIKLDEKKLEGWKEVYRDDMGELGLNLVLWNRLSSDEADEAAAGWNGDQVVLLKKGDKYSLILKSLWDTENDAAEFINSFKKWFGGKQSSSGVGSWMEDGERICLAKAKHSEVILIIGDMEKMVANKIMTNLMGSKK